MEQHPADYLRFHKEALKKASDATKINQLDQRGDHSLQQSAEAKERISILNTIRALAAETARLRGIKSDLERQKRSASKTFDTITNEELRRQAGESLQKITAEIGQLDRDIDIRNSEMITMSRKNWTWYSIVSNIENADSLPAERVVQIVQEVQKKAKKGVGSNLDDDDDEEGEEF